MPELQTSRLYLRYLTIADVSQAYVNWLNDPAVNRYLETRHIEQTIATCEEFIEQCQLDPGSHLFGVFLKETDEHIGNVKIGSIHEHYMRGQISLFIGEKKYWGLGLSSELVSAVTEYGIKKLGLHRLEAGCYEDNLASLRVFLKNGYTVEGFFRGHVISNNNRQGCFWLGILANEFNATN